MTEDAGMIFDAINEIKTGIKNLEDKTTSIQMTLENEVRNNIRIIAEGHLSLERKLDDALKVNQEKELLLIRINNLENEIRLLKEQINGIA